ncbi:MAG: hydroxymethylglutaryl-CoA lyase [Phycisphaerales bacterium]|nr:hydroxymethylglutaryl-CoA lyase [Phycisphaerales bacterium]MCI0676694.1 hydroxymethylglutaryl-CoA lyase [Phycisphaerales bacterium]
MPPATESIAITEVGPRDGLQNESAIIPTPLKVAFINLLSECGFPEIEVSSFVSRKWIPQLGDASEVFAQIKRRPGVIYSALVPNIQGMEAALKANVGKISLFTAASETFSQKNTNASIAQTLERFKPVIALAKSPQKSGTGVSPVHSRDARATVSLPVRAYISCAVACPYEGPTDPRKVREVASQLLDLGVDEIDLADTIGVAVPADIEKLYAALDGLLEPWHTTLHLHDTRGTALACATRAHQLGVRRFDSSAAGLGGCPYAPGAAGNVATEAIVWSFQKMGVQTGVDSSKLATAVRFIATALDRPLPGPMANVQV